MKPMIAVLLLVYCNNLAAQNEGFLKLVLNDKSNFDITTKLGNKKPIKYYLLSKTEKWNGYRFKLKENVKLDSVRKKLEANEHHPYNHKYLFKDKMLDTLFLDEEKEQLYAAALESCHAPVKNIGKIVHLISSYEVMKPGFFFSITSPIYSSDSQFAFIDIAVFLKDSYTKDCRDMYFGNTILVYKKVRDKGWVRFKKRDYLIL